MTLPYSQLTNASAPLLGNLWLRLRYGVFSDLDSAPDPTSRQYSECRGKTVSEVMMNHPDFSAPRLHTNYTRPRYTLVQPALPRFIIVLENSAAMNLHDHWESVRTACKKLILHDLPEEVELGLVLYNEEAHISHPVGRLGKKTISPTRNGLAFSIRNKHNLSPSNGSCVSCGVLKAVEALQTSGASRGGVVVVVGRGGPTSSRDEEHMRKLALKHRLQVFPVVLPGGVEQSLNLELLAHSTGANSFILHHNPNHSIYMHLLDALRVIKENTIPGSNKLVSTLLVQLYMIYLNFN